MQFRAIGLDSNVYEFTVQDCPVSINSGVTALTAKPHSKMLWSKTITRCSNTGYAEGDTVYQNEECIGYVIYDAGFKVYNAKEKKCSDIPVGATFKRGSYYTMKEAALNPLRTRITLKAGNEQFELNGIVCYYKDGVGAVTSRTFSESYVNLQDIQHTTGIVVNNQSLFYGDIYNGGVIVLHNGKPAIKKSDGTIEQL